MLGLALSLVAAIAQGSQDPQGSVAGFAGLQPSVYWTSNPVLPNETLLVAGMGFDLLQRSSIRLCLDAACTKTLPTPAFDAWNQSLKMVIPAGCGPPCILQLGNETVALNAPDVWWLHAGSPAVGPQRSKWELANAPTMATVHAGDSIRVFGRSLGWDTAGSCISAALAPQPGTKTKLVLDGSTTLPAVAAGCYEATFDSTGVVPGSYAGATLTTEWGDSAKLSVTIVASSATPSMHQIDVNGGDLLSAIAQAAALVTADPHLRVTLQLGAHKYSLKDQLFLPSRTSLTGLGEGVSTLVFDMLQPAPPPGPPSPPVACGAPLLEDLTQPCTPGQTGPDGKEHACTVDVASTHDAGSVAGCCAACNANPDCNGYTFVGSVDQPGGYCGLRYCANPPNCDSTPSSKGPNNRTSGWLLGKKIERPPAAHGAMGAIVVAGDDSVLANFSLQVNTARPFTPAVWMQANATSFVASGLNITLLQNNVSNAFKVEGVGYEIVGNKMNQVGSCNYPNYGPKSDATPFMPSVTIYLHNSRAGRIAENMVYWRCSAYDLDISDKVQFEENHVICTEPGVPTPLNEPLYLATHLAVLVKRDPFVGAGSASRQ